MLTATLHTALPHTALADGATAPEWLHLVPAGSFRGQDGRGPYVLGDPAALIAASMAEGPLVLDENHATDHAAKSGGTAPAAGWITALETRTGDGIWGRVDWTPPGAALLAARAYRGISPVIVHDASGRVLRLLRAALTNVPNLAQLRTLHTQGHQMDLTPIRAALGLPDTADDAAILAAIAENARSVAAHSSQAGEITRMATEMVTLQTRLATAEQREARAAATLVVDGAIRAGVPIPAALREHYIARHIADPASVATELAALPRLHAGGILAPPKAGDPAAPDPDESRVIALLGIDAAAFMKQKAALGLTAGAA